jgi:hypothetical protein
MKLFFQKHHPVTEFRRSISFSASVLTNVFMVSVLFLQPAEAAMLPGSQPKEWPADPTKHQVAIRREAADEKQSAMIAAAEAAQPAVEALRNAAHALDRNDPLGLAHKKEVPLQAGDKVWWYRELLGIRIPYAITADAVAYYAELVGNYGKQPLHRYTQPSSSLDYRAAVKFHQEFKLNDKTFHDVHVVTLKLIFSQNFVATQTEGMQFEKQRVVILDANGKVLFISGDGPTEVPVLSI